MKTFSEFLNEKENKYTVGYIREISKNPGNYEAYIETLRHEPGSPAVSSEQHNGKATYGMFKTYDDALNHLRNIDKHIKIYFTDEKKRTKTI